jgi:glycerophosphoryl diester phosphodiesterase
MPVDSSHGWTMAPILSASVSPRVPFGLSYRQTEVAARVQCYLEKILRSLNVTHPGWQAEQGWTDADSKPYKDANEDPTVCDVLHYKKPVATRCSDVDKFPFDPPMQDLSVLRGIARIELVRRRPELQQAIFGWKTPAPKDTRGWQAFESAKTAYWDNCTHENRMEMHTLQDTADFHANDLLRALYLYGEMPVHLRTPDSVWRTSSEFGRDDNFSATIESQILDRLLMFKYWIDEPFAIDDPARPGDTKLITAERARLAATKKHVGGPAGPNDDREYPKDDDSKLAEMTFWSENHQFLFATAEYLAGQWLPTSVFRAGNPYRSEGPDRTRPGDLTGNQHMSKARKRLIRWLDDRLRFGFSEWNAPGYYEEDLSPLFNLADFCLDEQVRTRAHMVLDLVVFDLARFSMRGSFGVSAGRDYFEHKNCGYGQSVGDLIEVLFGTRNNIIVDGNSGCAISFASSRRYVVPDALVEVASDPHPQMSDRSRVSVTFDDAPLYGIGVESDEDVMFWWSRAAYFVKQVIQNTHKLASKSHLLDTAPFKDILPKIDTGGTVVAFGDGLAYLAAAMGSPALAAALIPLLGSPLSNKESDIANAVSVLTEGSALTRSNLYTYKDRNAMLSSAQNFRPGQFNFQTQAVMATLSMEAMVWTGHPSAGAYISKEALETSGEVGGAVAGAAVGSVFGPLGAIAGGVLGAIGGKKAGDALAGSDPKGIEIYPADTHDGPNWWTGTVTSPRVVQRDNAAIAIYKPQDFQKLLFGARTHAWFPKAAFDEGSVFQRGGNSNVDGLWTFGRCGDGYIALYSAKRPTWTSGGPWKDKELLIEENGNIFIYQVGSVDEFGSFDSFVDSVCRARIHVDDLDECSYDIPNRRRLELHYDHGVRYNGRSFSDDRFPRFQNPYVSAGWVGWTQYNYTISHNGATLTHDFRELKTVRDDPKVYRYVQGTVRNENDHFLVIAHHGSPKTSVENTLQSCHQAVQIERANALEIDLCVTKDNQIILWHDWNPDDAVALVRQLGEQGNNRFRPTNPDLMSSWRKPVNELTLEEFRIHYGYEEIEGRDYAGEINPVDPRIPTLLEFMQAAANWDNLEHLFLDIKMPDADADGASTLVDLINQALAVPHQFAVTALVPHEKVLQGMKNRASEMQAKMAFSWDREFPAGIVLDSSDFSAIDGAIKYGNTVASVGRPTSLTFRPWHVYQTIIQYDTQKWDQFNLDPKTNQGRQIDKLIAWTIDDANEMDWLLTQGVSGVITDDVPMLREAAEAAELPL